MQMTALMLPLFHPDKESECKACKFIIKSDWCKKKTYYLKFNF